ncbi:MAG: transcription termination/antitermination protein NusG [Kiritimatiellae bacterium]|nr:transcription termination/antitermination protein NusG [Kiritimatiellia bacterium]
MSMQWFVLNTLTGQEQKVQKMLKAKASEGVVDLTPFVGETLVPTEKVVSQRNGRKATVTRKLFPGYVFAELGLYRDAPRCKQLNKALWEYVNGLQGVIGFLGAERNARGEMVRPPVPMTAEEVANIRATGGATAEKPRPEVAYEPGELVKIADGPFLNSVGVVQSVDPERGRLTVAVTLFGGDTPVDLEYWQVQRHAPEAEKPAPAPAPEAADSPEAAFDSLPTF